MKEQLLKIIDSHNAVVKALGECKCKVDTENAGGIFSAMAVWHKLACEGADITHLARENGIDAKTDMQSGKILIYGELREEQK